MKEPNNKTMGKSRKKPIPQNRPSALFYKHGIDDRMLLDGQPHGHRSTPNTNRMLTHRLRQALKREARRIIDQQREDR